VNQQEVFGMLNAKKGSWNEFESKKLISLYNISITKEKLATSVEEAKEMAEEIGYPVVLKVMSHDITHKTEAGIIALNVKDEVELRACYHEILKNAKKYKPQADIQGVLVQERVKEGIEVIVGMSQDPQFGPVLMFGLGGTAVEVMKDVSFRVPPITRLDAEAMIKEVRAYKILEGIRGKKMADIEAIIDTLMNLSHLSLMLKDSVAELDINPLIVFEKGEGAKAVDALVVSK
jgi:acyl-CoA synthetase (NDP forming)